MTSKYRTFDGEQYTLQIVRGTKQGAEQEVVSRNKTLTFRMRKYRIVPVSAKLFRENKVKGFNSKTAYAVYGS